jgi:poly(3-hydroxybutyrate) depolymerase
VIDDRIFATELLDALTFMLCIDESRIYIAGLSNGGGLTGLLACDPTFNKRIAAFAGVAAAFYTDDSLTEPLFGARCDPQLDEGRKVPFMELHGINDSVIAYDGTNAPDPDTIPLPEWVDGWVERDGCSGTTPVVEVLDGGNVTKSSWSCDGVEDVVVHYAIDKFGYVISTSLPYVAICLPFHSTQSFPSLPGRTVQCAIVLARVHYVGAIWLGRTPTPLECLLI